MEKIKHIDFKGLDSVRTRAAVRSFFRFPDNVQMVNVDFAKIGFLSRTAAHELLLVQNELSSKGVDISFLNVNTQVNEMLELVKKSLGREKQTGFRFVKWLTFEDEKKYEEYLLQF
jgi:anti-anti-sigma regulatory factor